jgi:hypothetical protein
MRLVLTLLTSLLCIDMIIGLPGASVVGNRVSSSAFSPSDISNLAYWFDAADGDTVLTTTSPDVPATNGDTVSKWLDKSGNDRHVTQVLSSNRPILRTNEQNGLPALEFDGSNDNLLVPGGIFNASSNISVFIVAQILAGDTYGTLFSETPGAGDGQSIAFQVATNPGALRMATDVWRPYGMFGSTTIATGDYYRFGYIVAPWEDVGTVTELYLNGVRETETTYGIKPTINPNGTIYIGSLGTPLASSFIQGKIAEVIVYDKELSAAERASIDDYLSSKWAT